MLQCFDCLELNDGDDRVECLCLRIKGKANRSDKEVSYRLPNQDKKTDEICYKQQGEVSLSLALVLMWDFSLP